MDQQAKGKKDRVGGRKPKLNPSRYRYSVNLNEDENHRLRAMMRQSGVDNFSRFILSALFGREIKVVKIDRDMEDYVIRLSEFYTQFQAVGNNYNQTVRAIKANFGEKRGLAMLYKLEKHTIELVVLSRQINSGRYVESTFVLGIHVFVFQSKFLNNFTHWNSYHFLISIKRYLDSFIGSK